MWLAKVREQTGNPIEVDWQPFSLSQVNNKDGDNVWERPEVISGEDPMLLAHKAGLAVKRQGKEAFESYFMALLKARHEDKADLNDQAVISTPPATPLASTWPASARTSPTRHCSKSWPRATPRPSTNTAPSVCPPSSSTTATSPSSRCSSRPMNSPWQIYNNLMKSMSEFVHVGEFKRPQPPWPHGVI